MRQLTEDQKRVKELVAAFNTPLVLFPGGWDDTLPEWLKLRAIAERVAMVSNGGWDKATDAEVTSYLYTASLAQPLGSDWTDITLYQAAKQMPQLYEALPNAPKELSDYQKQEIDHLKRDIRNSQLRRQNTRRKEGTMPTRKLVIDEKEGTVMMGVMKEGADPFIKNFQGDLETNLGEIPQLLQDAEAKWSVSLKNPTYKAPKVEPKKPVTKPATTAATGGTGKPTEDLPLLADNKPKEIAQPAAPEPAAAAPAPAEVAGEPEPAESGTEAPVGEPVATAPAMDGEPEPAESGTTPEAPEDDIDAGEFAETPAEAEAPKLTANETAGLAPVTGDTKAVKLPTAAPATAPTGEWQYRLKDGRGPFDSVQAAMDAMGLDKATRPQHNRWHRLSTSLKDTIRMEPKTS